MEQERSKKFVEMVTEVSDATYFSKMRGKKTLLFIYAEW
jgi:hypothetical protein